jgi:hypothetical protein
MAIDVGTSNIKALRVGSTVISRAFLGNQKIYDQLDYPTLDLNFALTKTLDPRITFTRASSGTFFDSNGAIQTAPVNTPRFDHDPLTGESLGLLIEEQRTNSIRNNTMVGAVAGTPGTLPTNWFTFTSLTGLTQQIVGTGIENGITYIDYKLSGTTSGAGTYNLFLEALGQIVATSSQVWTSSGYFKLVTGSLTNISSIACGSQSRTAAGGFIAQYSTSFTAGSTLKRSSNTTPALPATAERVVPVIIIIVSAAAAIDITLRIGLPQLELGAFATSPIPTTTTALTRALDVAVMTGTNFSNWYNQSEGTLFAEYVYLTTGISNQCAYSIDNGTSNETIVNASATPAIDRVISSAGGVPQANFGNFTFVAGQVVKRAVAVKLNDAATTANGLAVATDNIYIMPVPTQLTIGAAGYFSGSRVNGHIRRITYFNRRLANSELQLLSS